MKKTIALILVLALLLTVCAGAENAAAVPDLTIARREIPDNEAPINKVVEFRIRW